MFPRSAQRRLRAALGAVALLAAATAPALAHWLSPKEITGGLNQNQPLKERTGLVSAREDPDLPRLLVIKMNRERWLTVPPEQRLFLAQQWYDDWSHNVEEGIVAILDAATDKPLVNYDAAGKARLVGN